uniref:Uncharacterized protein n=1 Tax=Arundo donax TaxID=35708 RepID=A0A0A9BGL8_ARUDO
MLKLQILPLMQNERELSKPKGPPVLHDPELRHQCFIYMKIPKKLHPHSL